MSFLLGRINTRRGAVRGYILAALALMLVPMWLWADAPAWWAQRGVLNPAATADDYAAVNQGQVKNIAKQAYEEVKEKLPNGPGATLDALWAIPAASTDDYAAINIGQLKNVAKPFYDRLITENVVSAYPWGTSTDDYALANIGQVKNLFSFVVPSAPVDPNDTDGNGLPDAWEMEHFGHLGVDPNADSDGDGVSNLAEYMTGTDPLSSDNTNVMHMIVFAPSSR